MMLEIANTVQYVAAALVALLLLARWNRKRSAQKLLTQQKSLYSGKMEHAEVHPKDFPWLDESFYDDVSRRMAYARFRCVGDFECLTISRLFPSMRTFSRSFVGHAGTIKAGACHVKTRRLMSVSSVLHFIPKNIQILEFGSEFDDHTFLITHNCADLDSCPECPGITAEQLDPSTPLEQLLSHHRKRLQSIMEERKVQPIRFSTKDDIFASQDRMHELKSRHTRRIGYVTRDQFEAIAGGKLSSGQREFVDDFEKARDDSQTP